MVRPSPLFGLALGALLGLAAAALPACGGEGSACSSSEDCSGSRECAGPSQPQVCGIPARELCSSDADCFDQVCQPIPDACSPDGVGSECRQPCTTSGCFPGFRCGDTGTCEPIPCDDPEAEPCPSYQQCDPSVAVTGPIYARSAGCVAINCSDDEGCPDDTACVNGVCQDGPGTCVEPTAVP